MDPSALRSELAEALSSEDPLPVETLNMACLWISREMAGLDFSARGAGPLARCLVRAAGRILIDAAGAGADVASWANTEETVLLWIDEVLREAGYRLEPIGDGGRPPLPDASADWH